MPAQELFTMPKTKRIYEMDALILEALKIVSNNQADGTKESVEGHQLEKKNVGASKDILLRMIASLKKG